MPTTTNNTQTDSVNQEVLASTTLAALKPELDALLLEELIPITVDIPSAVALVLGSLPEIRALREDIARSMPNFDLVAFDKLEDYALALNDAQGSYLGATQPGNDLQALIEEGTRLREILLSDATTLALRGMINRDQLAELKGAVGFKNLATDLNVLHKVLSGSWAQIEGKSGVQAAELERAAKLGQRIIRLVGLREQGTASVAAATDLRLRAFTLFARTYDHARRAVNFLRWNAGDAEKIAPSLYSGRTSKRRGSDVAPEAGAGAGVPPNPASATNTAATSATAASGVTTGTPASAATPSSDPFLS